MRSREVASGAREKRASESAGETRGCGGWGVRSDGEAGRVRRRNRPGALEVGTKAVLDAPYPNRSKRSSPFPENAWRMEIDGQKILAILFAILMVASSLAYAVTIL